MRKALIKIEQTGSAIRRHHSQRETLIGLGLNRTGRVAHVPDTPEIRGMIAKVAHLVRVVREPARMEFVSEDDLQTFEVWSKEIQGIDPAMLEPNDLAQWRSVHQDVMAKSAATPKVGLMKLHAGPGEYLYAVAIREDSKLWLTLWVRRSRKREIFVMIPRGDRGWDSTVRCIQRALTISSGCRKNGNL